MTQTKTKRPRVLYPVLKRDGTPVLSAEGNQGTPLNPRQQLFVEHYLECWNVTQAYRLAGYADKGYAHTTARRLLQMPTVKHAIDTRLKSLGMGADEVLARLASQARGDLSPFLTKTGKISIVTPQAKKNLHLLKKIRTKTRVLKTGSHGLGIEETEVDIEPHDAQAALVQLGRYHKLFTDKVEVDTQAYDSYKKRLDDFLDAKDITPVPNGTQDQGEPE